MCNSKKIASDSLKTKRLLSEFFYSLNLLPLEIIMIHGIHCKMKCHWFFDVKTLGGIVKVFKKQTGDGKRGQVKLEVENS